MATDTATYNGWTNYETWCVNLWLSNEQGSYDYWTEAAMEQWNEAEENPNKHWTRSECARFRLADRLKDELEEARPELGATMWADMLGAAFQEVNWQEIANAWLQNDEILEAGYEAT